MADKISLVKALFYSARLKVERAKEHINDAYRRSQSFAETHPHTVTVELDPVSGNDVLRIAPADPLPDALLLILGDALHNLRSALDHAWVEMQATPSEWSKFPVRNTKQDFESALNGLAKNGPSEDIKKFLIDVVQPYRGGRGEMIVDLHNLDIRDKHLLLIAHLQYTIVSGLTAIDDRGEEFAIGDWIIRPFITTSQPFEGHRKFRITQYGVARTEVVFGENMPLQGRRVMPAMNSLIELVSSFIDCCETILLL